MPTYPVPPLPQSIDPKQSSVFDPLYQTLARRATGILGLDDPSSMTMQSAIPTPLVAAVKPQSIPQLKEYGKILVDRIKGHGIDGEAAPKNLVTALEWMQNKYPRMFGHIEDIRSLPAENKKTLGRQLPFPDLWSTEPKKTNPFSVMGLSVPNHEGFISKIGLKATPEEYIDTISHEMLHAKDNLMNGPNFMKDYHNIGEFSGYENNPYEIRARKQGISSVQKYTASKPKTPGMIDTLMNLFNKGE